jgi:hypothetical protein
MGLAGSYPLIYEYNLSGGLKSITDHTDAKVSYNYDDTGQLEEVSGMGSGGAGQPGLEYRSSGFDTNFSELNGVTGNSEGQLGRSLSVMLLNAAFAPQNLFADAYTDSQRDIYFRNGVYNPYSIEGIALIAHELVHANQYREHGAAKFMAKYLGNYVGDRLSGSAAVEAYEDNEFEEEAFSLQDHIKDYLTKKYKAQSPCKPEPNDPKVRGLN